MTKYELITSKNKVRWSWPSAKDDLGLRLKMILAFG